MFLALDLSYPFDTSARPVFRSLYKTITNCALCDYLHAVFSKRIWITWLWLKILNWKNANWIFGQKWNSWNSMRQIRKKTAVIEARLLIFSNAIMTNDVIIRQHWVREMQNHEGRQQKKWKARKRRKSDICKRCTLRRTGKLDISQEISKEKGNKFLS